MLLVAVAAACLASTPVIAAPPEPGHLVISGGPVLAPEGDRWLLGRAVLVVAGRVTAIVAVETVPLNPDVPHLDLAGAYLVPGLIDLHTHLLLHPYDEASWEHQVLKESLGLRTARAVAAAKATLEAGFTTIRELGTEGAGYADVGLRDAIAAGIVPGPGILAATRALVASGAYGPSGFDPRWSIPKGAEVADGPDGMRAAVRRQIAAGADWIKVYADYRRRAGDPATPTFTLAELKAAVDEAHSAGLSVSAHATTDQAARRAVEAGVRTIEHGTGLSDETFALMRQHGVALCPTLATSEAMARYGGWQQGTPPPAQLQQSMDMFRRALAAGVTIACGSDAGVFAHGLNAREIELMVDGGMSSAEALRSATATAADVIGRGDDLGRVAPGYVADLVAVAADPLRDISALREPVLVIQAGRIVVDRRSTPDHDTRQEVLAVCTRMLDLLGDRRFDDLAEMFVPGALVAFDRQTVDRQGAVTIEQFLQDARDQADPQPQFREWLTGEATVLVDGAIAVVWAPFIVEVGSIRAAGTDVFKLVKLDGRWRISGLSYTNRPL